MSNPDITPTTEQPLPEWVCRICNGGGVLFSEDWWAKVNGRPTDIKERTCWSCGGTGRKQA